MRVTVSKKLAATQQLDVAIELLLADRDPLAVRTLAAAAHGVLSDLVEATSPGTSWRERLISDSGLTRSDAMRVLNGASNFLKHANNDPEAELSFEEQENDHVIFFATLECGQLKHRLSYTMQAFQIWYLACHPEQLGFESELVRKATGALPNIHFQQRQEQLRRGGTFVRSMVDRYRESA
jgi:hypothetical protein